jgi:hypothetical protein
LITYIYDPHTGDITAANTEAYAEWMKQFPNARRIAETTLGECWISTVFLGLDHSFGLGGQPVLFETMVFWEEHQDIHNDCTRCETLKEAKKMHEDMCHQMERYIYDLNQEECVRIEMWPEKSYD